MSRLGLGIGGGTRRKHWGLGLMSGRGGVSAQVAQFLARVQTQSPAYRAAYAALIDGIVADNLWSKIDAGYVLRAHGYEPSLTNLKSSSYTAGVHGVPTFAPDAGWTGTGNVADYLNTTFNPTTAIGPQFARTSNTLIGSASAGGKTVTQALLGYVWAHIEPFFLGDSKTYWNAQSAELSFASPASLVGTWIATRTSEGVMKLYKDNVEIATSAAASVAFSNQDIMILMIGGTEPSSMTMDFAFIASGLTPTDVANFTARIAAFKAAAPTAVLSGYHFFDDFSGPDAPFNAARTPVYGLKQWATTGAAIVADPTTVRVGAGKFYKTAANGNAYGVMQLTGTPSLWGGVFESDGGAWSPTIACIKDYAGHAFTAMFHANLNQGTGMFSPGIWNDVWNGAGAPEVNRAPTSVVNGSFTLVSGTRYREEATVSGTTVTQRLYSIGGTQLAQCVSTDAAIPSVIGPWVFFETGDTSTIWHEAYAKT